MKASTTCNSCDFASIQAGDLRRHVKTNIWENHTHANIVTLHLFKHAIWEDTWKLTPEKITRIWEKHTHATIMTLHLFNHATWEDFWNHLIAKFGISATIVTLHLYKQAIWEDIWKLTFEKSTHMQLIWLCVCSIKRFERMLENHLMEKFCISATLVTLHLFKKASLEDTWKLTFEKKTHTHTRN